MTKIDPTATPMPVGRAFQIMTPISA